MTAPAPSDAQRFSYDAHARTCPPDDFLGQTKRTVQGKPLGEDQIQLIVAQMRHLLDLAPPDRLAEIACGNGYLSQRLFPQLQGYRGSDISDYLISVAQKNFERPPDFTFSCQGGLEHVLSEIRPEAYSKMLCYAAAQYFPDDQLSELLQTVRRRYTGVARLMIGNCPDRSRAGQFFGSDMPSNEVLDDTGTALGRWRLPSDFSAIAANAGWDVQFASMPPQFSGATYRFDALLTPRAASAASA